MDRMETESISKYLRGLAIIGVVAENFLSWVPINSSSLMVQAGIENIRFLGASLVHIFFFLSGYALINKYNDFATFAWKRYAINRFAKIVVPYWIVVTATYFFINLLHSQNPEIFEASFGLSDLLSYLLFLRNFNRSAWGLNPTLWFMQVIFGLYIVFPFLFYLMSRRSLKSFLLISALIAYSSRCLFWIFGYQPNRESSIFLFYIFEFSVGMALARIPDGKQIFSKIASSGVLCNLLWVSGYAISYILKVRVAIGANLHEVFTYFGSVALGISCYQAANYLRIEKVQAALMSIGNAAFVIYIIHAPPIQHFIRPILRKSYNNGQGVLVVSILFFVYTFLIILISANLSKYFRALASRIETTMKKRFSVGTSG